MTSIWAEIRNDHIEDNLDSGFVMKPIDAWKTDDDNEEGNIIAKVFGKWVGKEPAIFVDYLDYRAKEDAYAQEMIEEAKQDIIRHITPFPNRITITKCSFENAWYKDFIGKTFNVLDVWEDAEDYYLVNYYGELFNPALATEEDEVLGMEYAGSEHGILIEDCIPTEPIYFDIWNDKDSNIGYVLADITEIEMREFIKEYKELTIQKEKEKFISNPGNKEQEFYESDVEFEENEFLEFLRTEKERTVTVIEKPKNYITFDN